MKVILICPGRREAVAALMEREPLVNVQLLGKSLLEYWLEHLVEKGADTVQILAADRPEQVRALVGDGARWGLHVSVHPERRELSADEARAKYREQGDEPWLPEPLDAIVLDRFPGLLGPASGRGGKAFARLLPGVGGQKEGEPSADCGAECEGDHGRAHVRGTA